MTRVNRPDTLLTELRELRRRLRVLEGSRMRTAAPLAAPSTGTPTLRPARPSDWPSTASADWEPLLEGSFAGTLAIRVVANQNTTGSARVVVDGTVVGDEIAVTSERAEHTVTVEGGEVTVEARRLTGEGAVHVQAWPT